MTRLKEGYKVHKVEFGNRINDNCAPIDISEQFRYYYGYLRDSSDASTKPVSVYPVLTDSIPCANGSNRYLYIWL
eukprot:Awhi_evm1s520